MEFCRFSASESRAEDAEDEARFLDLAEALCSLVSDRGELGFCQSEVVIGIREAILVDSKGFVRKMSTEAGSDIGEGVKESEPYRKVYNSLAVSLVPHRTRRLRKDMEARRRERQHKLQLRSLLFVIRANDRCGHGRPHDNAIMQRERV